MSPFLRASRGLGAPVRAFSRLSLAVACLLSSGLHAHAQGQSLPAVVVTASRTPMRVDQAVADVTLIDREDIERSGARSLVELLARQPGVQVTSYGGLATSVFLRGMESRHTLLLVDGVRYGSATLGTPSWENLPLPLVDRIEIVRGPLSGLYGSDAVGGVIHVFTRRGEAGLHTNAQVTMGSQRYGQAAAGLSFGQGAWDGAVQVEHTQTRGISSTNSREQWGYFNPDRDGFRQQAASARLGLKLDGGWRVDANLLRSDGEIHFDEGPVADSRGKLVSEVIGLTVQGKFAPDWASVLRLSRSTDGFNTLVNDGSYELGNTGTVQTQITWENSLASSWGTVLLLAESTQQKVSRPGDPFEVPQRTINGVAAGLDGHYQDHAWQANVRHDENSQFGAQTKGTLGYGYRLSPAWRATAALGTSYVAPSFNQLYYPGYGNPDLLPEEGNHRELGLRWGQENQQVKLAWFDNRIRGYISSGASPVNIPRTLTDGLSLSHFWCTEQGSLVSTLEHLNPRNVTPGPDEGKQLPRRAQDSLKVSADANRGAWQWGADYSAYGRRFDDVANTQRLGGFATLDLRADWRLAPSWTLGWRLANIFDKQYETNYGYNQSGREAFMTLRYSGL